MTTTPLPEIPISEIQAWAEAGIISPARYVEEVDRRRHEQQIARRLGVIPAPDDSSVTHHPV